MAVALDRRGVARRSLERQLDCAGIEPAQTVCWMVWSPKGVSTTRLVVDHTGRA